MMSTTASRCDQQVAVVGLNGASGTVRKTQLSGGALMSHQKHTLEERDKHSAVDKEAYLTAHLIDSFQILELNSIHHHLGQCTLVLLGC